MGTTTTLPAGPAARPATYDPALAAYEEMAVVYDAFTRAYDYERFLTVIEQLALEHGLAGRDVLDVACGTGKSFMPLLRRGYRVTACDLSPEMVRLAQSKSEGKARVVVADMRALPELGQFDLITCLDDSINYLLTDGEVAAALGGIARLLRPGGLLLFDLNSLRTYRSVFSQTFASDEDGVFFCWRGDTSPRLEAGGRAAATLEAFLPRSGGSWSRRCMRHVQRHHPPTTMSLISAAAGLDVIKVWGQRPGVQLDPIPAEDEHTKLLYLARRSTPAAP
jgi:SAM-dependent methyltransferase